ncbi:MAG TPA: MFS transporter [Thermoanaerobaculia bacterium]|jgi:fucose permease
MNRRALFASACAGMFVFGIVLAILGALFGLPEMRSRLDVDLAQQGDIFLTLFLGIFLSTIVVGPMIDSFGNKVVLTASAVFVAVALAIFAYAHSFYAALVAAALLGFGGGGLNTSANALIADIYPDNRGPMLNMLGIFFGFGALFIPFLMASIAGRLSIPQLLLIAAALAAVCAIAYLVMPFPRPHETVGFSLLASIKAVRIPGVLLFGVLLFFQSGNEASIGGWTSTYIVSLGIRPQMATWILAFYWAALMLGRFISAKLLERMTKERLVLASGAGSAIGCAVLMASHSIYVIALGAVIIGLSFAAVYPTTLAIAADRYERLAGTIFGLLFAMGLIGGMIFPWIVGQVAQMRSVRAGMIVPLAGAIAIFVVAGVVPASGRPSEGRRDGGTTR